MIPANIYRYLDGYELAELLEGYRDALNGKDWPSDYPPPTYRMGRAIAMERQAELRSAND